MRYSLLFQEWYEKARSDLRGAEIIFEHSGEGIDYGLVAFHCQQAIEKALKGFLLKNTNHLNEGHSLPRLCIEAITFLPKLKDYVKDCSFVGHFYIDARYPQQNRAVLRKEDAQECIDIVKKLFKLLGV